MEIWNHINSPLQDSKNPRGQRPYREMVESVTEEYLNLPFRCQAVERLIIDILLATEISAYIQETINAPSIPIISSSTFRKRPILEWFAGLILNAAFWGLAALGLFGLSRIHLFPNSWLPFAYGAFILLWTLSFVLSTILLPKNWWNNRKAKLEIVRLFELMTSVYAEMKSSGPISAKHIEQRARAASEGGVGWPAPLFVLLDDINRRGVAI